MPARPGLRRPTYQGVDPGAEQLGRNINDILSYLQRLPFSDGVLLQNVDFSGLKPTTVRTYPLKHLLNRKARGVVAIGCHPKQFEMPQVVSGMPTHVTQQDTVAAAYVCLSPDMANDFIWDFWIW
jgi:hypothetical protein